MTRLPCITGRRSALLLALLGLPALLQACPVESEDSAYLYSTTAAPPALEARIDNSNDEQLRIYLSEGAALGVTCSSTCPESCEGAAILPSGEGLEVLPAYFSRGYGSPHFVLVAKTQGEHAITLKTACATTTYNVSVTPQPASP